MPESLTTIERSRRYYPLAIASLSVIALSGCTDVRELNPDSRVAYDYIYSGSANSAENACLSGTAFDLTAGGEGRASFTPPSASYDAETDILRLTAVNGETLSLTGFTQFEHTVEPTDSESQAIFAAFGCEVVEYER